MPTIETRPCADGSVSHRVRWAQGGRNGVKQTVTFNSAVAADAAARAHTFAQLVRAAGEKMPNDIQLHAFGFGELAATAPANRVTVTDMCSSYIDYRERNLGTAPEPQTIDLYRSYVRRYIAPLALGRRDAADPALTFADIDAWQNHLMTAGSPIGRGPLSRRSVLAVRSQLVSGAFAWACSAKSGKIRTAENPMIDSDAPRLGRDVPFQRERLTTPDEYAVMLRHAFAVDPEFGAMVITAAATGVRDGEYRQLRPEHVNPDRRSLVIAERVTGARRVMPGSKNHTTREVPVPDAIFDRFVAPRLHGRPHVFVGPAGDRWAYATERTRWIELRARMAADGLPQHITPHSLRHGYVTHMTLLMPEIKVALLVGHIKKSQTADYARRLTDADHATARRHAAALVPVPRVQGTKRLR